jgi:hypothetical protein
VRDQASDVLTFLNRKLSSSELILTKYIPYPKTDNG